MKTAMNQENANQAKKLAQVKVSIDPEVAAAFKGACAASSVSMAAVLAKFMADYSKCPVRCRTVCDYSTRRLRRSAVKAMIGQMHQMKLWEEGVRDNMPGNLQGSAAYEAAEEAISSLEEAIDALSAFWMVP